MFLAPLTSTEIGSKGVAISCQCIFQWLISMPCFFVLFIAWETCLDMQNGRLFTFENAKRIKRASILLLSSVISFVIGKVLFYLLGWNKELIIHMIIFIIGFTVWVMIAALSHYIGSAAKLQEESDFTV